MERLGTKIEFKDENGNKFDLTILKEFSLKEKKYAVLMEEESCEHDCNCCDKNLVLLEVSNEDGKETFNAIKDEKLFDEVVSKAEEEMYKD